MMITESEYNKRNYSRRSRHGRERTRRSKVRVIGVPDAEN